MPLRKMRLDTFTQKTLKIFSVILQQADKLSRLSFVLIVDDLSCLS
jgi:hypothetical protein